MDGHGTSPLGRCEGSPEPSEVSTLGKLSVFSKSLIGTLGSSCITIQGRLSVVNAWYLTSMSDCSKMMDNNRLLFIFSDKSYKSKEEVADDE